VSRLPGLLFAAACLCAAAAAVSGGSRQESVVLDIYGQQRLSWTSGDTSVTYLTRSRNPWWFNLKLVPLYDGISTGWVQRVQITPVHSREFHSVTLSLNSNAVSRLFGSILVCGGQFGEKVEVTAVGGGMTRSAGIVFDDEVYDRYAIGGMNLNDYLNYTVTNRLAATGFDTNSIPLFGDGYPSELVRNPDNWCADVDLSCASPWNSRAGRLRAGTLITGRHFVNAQHYPLSAGDRIVFVSKNGVSYTGTVEAAARILDTDIRLNRLTEEVPVDIVPVDVLGAQGYDLLQYHRDDLSFSLAVINQHEMLAAGKYTRGFPSVIAPISEELEEFWCDVKSGDSGDPSFIVVEGKAVFYGHSYSLLQTHNYIGLFPVMYGNTAILDEIDAQIERWGDTEQMERFNFETYRRDR